MRVPKHPTLVRRMLDARLRKLAFVAAEGPILASVFSVCHNRCGKPECRCHRGGPRHQSQHLTDRGDDGKTRTVYVPKDLIPEVRVWTARHKRIKLLLKEIHLLTLALVRTHAAHRRRQPIPS